VQAREDIEEAPAMESGGLFEGAFP
jgi:hypothetical protein